MLMKVKDCAKYLGVSEKTIYRWVEAEYIPHARIGNSIRFDDKVLDMWIKEKSHA